MTRSLIALWAITLPASAASVSFTPDNLSDFSANGTIVHRLNSNSAISNLTDPTAETPNALRFETLLSDDNQVVYSYDWLGATVSLHSLGSIDSIDFSIEVSDPNLSNQPGAIYLGLKQAGNVYFHHSGGTQIQFFQPTFGDATFTQQNAVGLTASDFGSFSLTGNPDWMTIDPSNNPDFSKIGADIQVIYAVVSATQNTTNRQRFIDFRNSSFTATAIPEPSGYLLSLLGLSYLFTRRQR